MNILKNINDLLEPIWLANGREEGSKILDLAYRISLSYQDSPENHWSTDRKRNVINILKKCELEIIRLNLIDKKIQVVLNNLIYKFEKIKIFTYNYENPRTMDLWEYENIEDTIKKVDPSLKYLGKTFSSTHRLVCIVKNNNGTKILKIANAPADIHLTIKEARLLRKLNIKGIPKIYKSYNCENYNPSKLTAILVQYIEGKQIGEIYINEKIRQKLEKLVDDLHYNGVYLSNDFNEFNIIIDNDGQPWFIDLEEVDIVNGPITTSIFGNIDYRARSDYKKINTLGKPNILKKIFRFFKGSLE